ncbi:MAG: FAD-dependent oxidoreductase [Pyrinomonadaceae bacterium]|nr:FAD-dependent oxidoreductase [Pyrinomonadaceae bacterium]
MRKSDEGRTRSYWEATASLIDSAAEMPSEADACIIGGGIAGLSTAYMLSSAGKKVVVFDDGLIGGGETCRTTAHISNAIDDRIYRIVEWHGMEKARLAVQAHTQAIDQIERIVNDEKIDCDFERLPGYLIEAKESDDDLDKEIAACRHCGLNDVEFVDRVPTGHFDSGRCLRFPRQAQFHIVKYLNGLAGAIESHGGTLLSNTRIAEWKGGDHPSVVTADGRSCNGKAVVLATNYPIMTKMFAQLPAYRTYVVGLQVPRSSVEPMLVWDTGDPYIYVRTQRNGSDDILIVGGEDHRTGQADDGDARFGKLEAWARERFPDAGESLYRWSGQFLETHDGLAFLGRHSDDKPNVYLITGDSGMGMTHCTIGAMLVSDLISGRDNPWKNVFDPSRLATQSIKQAVPEIVNSTIPYVDWLTPSEINSADELKNGDAAILREGTTKIAVYRDDQGSIHRRSAVCTHMGCIVRFNSTERTWDCPCHGSRFSLDGEPINTPAMTPLPPA